MGTKTASISGEPVFGSNIVVARPAQKSCQLEGLFTMNRLLKVIPAPSVVAGGGSSEPNLLQLFYIQHLIQIMREIRRVLRPDGVFWLNIGDSRAGGKGQSGQQSPEYQAARQGVSLNKPYHQVAGPKQTRALDDRAALRSNGIKPLDMVLIPEQLALAARADGWYVRSMIIWAKGVSGENEDGQNGERYVGNSMPNSVNGWRWERHRVRVEPRTRGSNEGLMPPQSHHPGQVPHRDGSFGNPSDTVWVNCPGCPKCAPNNGLVLRKGSWRPTQSHEYVLMLTKSPTYFCDREAVIEQAVYPAGESRFGGNNHKSLFTGSRTTAGLHTKDWTGNGRHNLRSVLTIPTAASSVEHFAVFPTRLVDTLVKSSTSEKGCCPICGAPWARVVVRNDHENRREPAYVPGNSPTKTDSTGWEPLCVATDEWRPTCSCSPAISPADPVPCLVLDPFSGSGTTALVCERLGLDSINIDTSAEYIELSRTRLAENEQKRIDERIKQLRRGERENKSNSPKTISKQNS